MNHKILQLRLDQVRLDGNTQMRVELDSGIVAEYRESYENGEVLPEPVVFHDGSHYWLAEGFHRWHAMSQANIKCAAFKVITGTNRDAFLYAVGTNRLHGLRRRPEDVRNCIRRMLQDEEWGRWSNAEIARRCKCDERTVSKEKKNLREEAEKKRRREEERRAAERQSAAANPHHRICGGEDDDEEEEQEETVNYRTKHGTTATMDVSKSKKSGTRERPVYPEEDPEKVMDAYWRSIKKAIRKAKMASFGVERLIRDVRETWDTIPVVVDDDEDENE